MGLPRGNVKSVAVPGHVTSLLPTPLGLLIHSDGLLLLHKGDSSPSPISCTDNLALVRDVATDGKDKVLALLADGDICQGEQGIMLTTLLAAYHQIKRENVFIN